MYIYIYCKVQSLSLDFIQLAIVGESEDLKKTINMVIFCSKCEGYLCVYLSLCFIEYWYVSVCAIARAIIMKNQIIKGRIKKKRFKRLENNKLIIKCLVSLFNGISTLFRLFNAEAILLEEQ